jgi:2-oxoglutarate dehydrogenase E2 component (dihydrolipoamide succinyltransferase)
MAIELKVPEVGESITEVEIGAWLKAPGDTVNRDEPVVALESEKATVELPSPETGVLGKILKNKGEVAKVGETIGYLEKTGGGGKPAGKTPAKAVSAQDAPGENEQFGAGPAMGEKPVRAATETAPIVMPAAQALLQQHSLKAEDVTATGPGGRLLKEDVLRHVEGQKKGPGTAPQTQQQPQQPAPPEAASASELPRKGVPGREEEIVPMSRLRRTVAERLVQAQHTAALLTTFNEIDMSGVITLRKEYGESFQQKYKVKLGFMSFFVKACIDALKQYPAINAEIRDSSVVYHNYYDIGVAVGSGKGLVVPVLRNAERMSFAEVEMAIADFGARARENKLKLDELQGGTFTISNGGVYGSLLSTPIVNPPQSGVLGMHAMQERPVAREGAVVIRPMMYVALTYDHRLVDGREAVSFLKRIKEVIETPARMLMEV